MQYWLLPAVGAMHLRLVLLAWLITARGQEQAKYDRLKSIEAEIKANGFAPLKNIASINERDGDGLTPLMIAAAAGQMDMVKSFLVAGARADLVNAKGDTPCMLAIQNGHYHTSVQLLRAPSTDLFQRNHLGANVLHQAVGAGLAVIAQEIMHSDFERRINPDTNDVVNAESRDGVLLVNTRLSGPSNLSGLMMAAQNGGTEVVRVLLQHKADVNAQTTSGETALMYASMMGNADIVALLLEQEDIRTDLATHDKSFTAIMMAASRGHLAVVEHLVAHALDKKQYHILDAQDIAGQTALDHASDAHEQQVIDRLVVAGISLGFAGPPNVSADVLRQREENLRKR